MPREQSGLDALELGPHLPEVILNQCGPAWMWKGRVQAMWNSPFQIVLLMVSPLVPPVIKSTQSTRRKEQHPVKVCKMHHPGGWNNHHNHKSILKRVSSHHPSFRLRGHLPQTASLGGSTLYIVFQSKLEFLQVLLDHRHLTLHEHDVLQRKRQVSPSWWHGALMKLTPCSPSHPPHKANDSHLSRWPKGRSWLIRDITLDKNCNGGRILFSPLEAAANRMSSQWHTSPLKAVVLK